MVTNQAAASIAPKLTVFSVPIKKREWSEDDQASYIDLDSSGKCDRYAQDSLFGAFTEGPEPLISSGLLEALKDKPGTYTKEELGEVQVRLPQRGFGGGGILSWNCFDGFVPDSASLDRISNQVSPVPDTSWAIEVRDNNETWFLLQK